MNLSKHKEKFIGDQKIKAVKELDSETFLGEPRVEVEFKSGEKDKFPLEVLEEVLTKKKSDPTELREERVKPIVHDILVRLTEAELPIEDIDYVINKIQWSIQENFEQMVKKIVGKKKERSTLYDWEKLINPTKPKE